jgi:hypothetical protein
MTPKLSVTKPALIIAARKKGHSVLTSESEITIDTGKYIFRVTQAGVVDGNGKSITTDEAYTLVMEAPIA